MTSSKKEERIGTTDIYLAAALQTLGYEMEIPDEPNGGRLTFSFPLSKELQEDMDKWFNKKLLINIQQFRYNMYQLKERIHYNAQTR